MPEGIKLSKYYILGVTGYDIEDVEFAQNSVYGFEGNTAGVPPTLKIETPANLSIWGDFEKPQFSGTATISSKSLYVTELSATLSIQNETTNKIEGEFTDTITCKIENDKPTWEFSEAGALTWDSENEKWNLDATKLPGLVELYNEKAKTKDGVYWLATLTVSGKSSSGHEGESSQSIRIDTVSPVVSLTSVTPSVSGSDYFGGTDTNTYLNGTVTVKGNIDEQNMADSDDAVSYDILAATGDDEPVSILSELIAHADELGVAFDGKIGKVVSINIPFNTRLISEFFHAFKGAAEDEKIKIEVKVTVKDKAGNLGTYSSNSLNDGKYFIIYQETDRPKIELGNADSAIVKADDVKINHNLFGTTSNNKLTISFSDDDSIAEYEVSVYNDKGELLPNANVSAQGENTPKANPYTFKPNKTTASLSYILPSEEAKYQIEIKAHDEFYLPATSLSSPNPYGEKIVEKFFVAVDSGAPEVEISKPAVGSFQSGSVQIEGSVSKAVDLEGTLTKTGSTKTEDTKKFSLKSTQMTKDGKSYNWTLPADVAEDGEYSIDVKVTDIYGQTAGKSRTFKVDTKSPEIKSATTSVDSANGLVPLDEMEYITLRTDVTDGAESKSVAGVSVVKYYLFTADQLKTENISQIKTAFDGTNWTQMNQGSTNDENVTSFNASVPVKTFATNSDGQIYEGKAYLYVATEDNVGNFAIKEEPVEINLDKSAPVIVVKDFDGTSEVETNGIAKATEPTQTFIVNVEDTNADLLTVNDGTLSVGGATTIAGGKGKSFVITPTWQGFNVNGSTKYEDTKTVTFTGKDTYSRATSKTVILKCDTYAPRVVLNRASGDTFSNSSSIELKGTVEDKNISGTSEYFKIYLVPPTSTSFETKTGLVTFEKNGEKYNFTANITGLNDTEYNVAIRANDSFGNISYWSTDASKTTAITGTDTASVNDIGDSISIDSLAPSSDIKLDSEGKLLDRQKASVTGASPYSLSFGSTYYTDKTFTLKGTITETNLIENDEQASSFSGTTKPTLTVSKEGRTPTVVALTLGANDGNGNYDWSYTSNYKEDGTDDGLYEYTLTVWDKSKQSFSKSITVSLDTKNPELAFTSPSENESFESDPAAKVAYSDDGVGIKDYTYKLYSISDDGTKTEIAIENDAITNGSATGSVNLKKAVGSTEGSYKVTAQVEDSLGHKSELVERNFYFDTSKPAVDEKAVGTSGLTTNAGTITLTGVVYDTNALYQNGAAGTVKITGTWNGQNRTVNATVTPEEKTVDGKSYTRKQYATWTYTFNTANKEGVVTSDENYLPDNTYNFAIIATDTAGKTNQISRTVTVDTVAPKFGTKDSSENDPTNVKPHVATKSGSDNWYKTNSLRFEGTATDVIDGVTGTGIKEVYFETANSTDGGTTWSGWTGKTSFAGTTSWAGTIDKVESKTQKFRVFVEDNAGNKSEPVEFGPFKIDMTEPTLASGSVRVNTAELSEENPFYSRGAKVNEGETVTNPNVTFSVADEENGSGIDKVYVKLYGKVTDAEVTANDSDLISVTADEGNGSCTASIPAAKITKSGTVYARIYDKAGNANDVSLFALTYDATDPVIQSATLKDSSDYTAYKPNQDVEKYYVNNTDGNFTLSGIATDNLGLKPAKLELKEGDDVKKTYEITNEAQLSEWSFAIGNDLKTGFAATETSPLIASLTVTDKAGNKATKDISIVFDTTKPAALHDWDLGSTPKDAVFRIGEDNNDLEELKTWRADHTSLTDADKDVGGKYAPGTYGKANTITVRGYFTEKGSGLQYVYYKVFSQSTAPNADEIKAFVDDYKNQKTGFFSAIAEDTKSVKFNTSTTAYEFRDIKTNFKSTISEFGIGKNYLVLVGVDYVGNAQADSIYYSDGTTPADSYYSINVDVEAPTVERVLADGESSTLLTNASSADLVIKGTAFDNPSAESYANASGIKSLSASIKVKEKTGTEKEYKTTDSAQISIVPSDNNTKWTVTVKKEIFANVDAGNFSVYVTATDNAGTGNSQTSNVGTISVDKVAPTVTLALPTDADTSTPAREINGIIDLSGTVKDANPLPETSIVAIQYIKKDDYTETDDSESAGTKWVTLTKDYKGESGKEMSALSLSGDYTFDIKNFDTTKIEPLNDDVYYIRAKAVDKAGNVGYSPIKDSNDNFIEITISQDSDRPVVKIVNLTEVTGAYPYILKYGTKSQIIATVSDDDGIGNVYISESPYEGTDAEPTTSVYVPTTGTLTFTPKADADANNNVDGEKKFYVYVQDTAGKEFYTTYYDDAAAASTAKYLNVPKLKVNDTALTDSANAAQFVYFSDSTSPEVGIINALAYKAGENATSAGAVNGGLNNTTKQYTEYEAVNASYVIGGTERQWVQFKISASDASGISGIYMEISYKDKSDAPKTLKRRTSANVGTEGSVVSTDTFVAAKESDGTTDSTTTKIWTTDKILFADAKGNISLKIIPYDASGLQGNGQVTFVADTTGPEIKITSPEPTDEVTGTVSVVGIATDQGGSKTASTKWLIPTRTQRKMTDDNALYTATKDLWLDTGFTAKSTASSWTFELKSGEISAYDTDGSDSASGSANGYAQSVADGVFILPFYVLSTDELGNRTIKRDYTIKHNPDADRPKTTISYPDQSGRTLGGTIRVTGESIIPAGEATVKAVYLQIGTVTDGVASFGDAAKTKASAAVNMVSGVNDGGYHYTVKTPAQVKTDNGFATDLNFGAGVSSSAWWGIPVTKTSSAWNFSLNANGELDPASGKTNHIAIRACAVNSDGKVGAWSTTYFVDVDSTAPTQIATLRQFASSGENAFSTTSVDSNLSTTKASAIRSYEAEMYLKGDWYLTVQLDDESLLESYSVKKGNQTLTSGYYASSKTWTYSDNSTSTGDTATAGKTVKHVSRTIFIPVDKTDEKVDYTVTVTDSNETGGHTINAVYSLRIDNTAPSITKIYKGSDSENSPVLTQNYTVNDENYIFTLGGKVTENGSGFERVVFYYVRENDASKNYNRQAILDPLVTSASGTADSKAYLFVDNGSGADGSTAILTKRTFTQDSTHSYDLWALAVPGKMKADGYTFEAGSSLSDNKHIRTGGLIEVGGVLRRIESISGTTVVFDSNTGVTADTDTTAYFPYAQVVDNTNTEKTESTSANPFKFQSGDDGDGMPETVSGSKSTGYLWDSSVHTTNIPDGPAKLVVLVFDKAGNVSGATYTVKVENSAPRLAKVFLGTDLNSNDSWQANEFVGYDLYNANETYGIGTTEVKASQTIQTASYGSAFTIKDKLAVVAEIVGGNGEIIMVYGKDATAATAVPSTGTGRGVSATADTTITGTDLISAADKIGSVTYNRKTVSTSLKGFTLTSKQVVGLADTATIAETNDGTGKKASFTFWDSTEELVQGSTSQNCVLYVTDFAIDLYDDIAPKTVVNPFYWQNLNSNSIYGSGKQVSGSYTTTSFSELQGHIELEADWTAKDSNNNYLSKYDGNTSGTALDADPKVSGKITFTGTAYDEHALSKLEFSFGDAFTNKEIAHYDKTESTWVKSAATMASNGYEVTIETDAKDSKGNSAVYGVFEDTAYFDQKGHKLYWNLSIDTAKITKVADKDVKLTVLATDLAGKTTETGVINTPVKSTGYIPGQELSSTVKYTVTDGTTNYPIYQMDVVPYITKVLTNLSNQNEGDPEVYSRTARGHYPIASNESSLELRGFNLAANSANITLSGISSLPTGQYAYTVNEIESINNKNNNASHGVYDVSAEGLAEKTKVSNMYNRQPNTTNNLTLTDDVYFDMWELNPTAAIPTDGAVVDPVMKINPSSNVIGFAFASGLISFCMPSNTSSYNHWQDSYDSYASIGLTYDRYGNSFGVAAGADLNEHQADLFNFLTSKWGTGATGKGGSTKDDSNLRLESIGQNFDANNNGKIDTIWGGPDTLYVDKKRIQSPSLATGLADENNTNVYLAYYDNINDEIRFRSGIIGKSKASNGTLTDDYPTNEMNNKDNIPNRGGYTSNRCQIIANATGSGTLGKAGNYVSIAVVNNADTGNRDYVVMVWYDQHSKKLYYAYNTNPLAGTTGVNTTNWTGVKQILSRGGEYCQIAVDKDGGIHIAAYENGKLKYAKLAKFNSPNVSVCTVDSYDIIGQNLTLDVAYEVDENGVGHNIPHIGYYALSRTLPKYAYLAKPDSEDLNGADSSNFFTGVWESTYIPTQQTVPQDRINVGVFKNNGVRAYSTINKEANGTRGTSTTSAGSGTCYGNGTNNPVIGYAIRFSSRSTYAEVAQKK